MERQTRKSISIRVGPQGEIVIPDIFLKEMGLQEGDLVRARLENGVLLLFSGQSIFRHKNITISLADELIQDRRKEASNDDRELK